jgi:hypothetical protein
MVLNVRFHYLPIGVKLIFFKILIWLKFFLKKNQDKNILHQTIQVNNKVNTPWYAKVSLSVGNITCHKIVFNEYLMGRGVFAPRPGLYSTQPVQTWSRENHKPRNGIGQYIHENLRLNKYWFPSYQADSPSLF